MWQGMNRNTGQAISDIEHIRQSVRDILITPIGSRVMRRNYGSWLFDVIDAPINDILRLKLMSMIYSAIMRWEPRVRVSSVMVTQDNSALIVDLSLQRTDSNEQFKLSVELSK